jgi:hypothetical protein
MCFDTVNQAMDVGGGYLALGTSYANALNQLFAVELLALAVALDEHGRNNDRALYGAEAPFAGVTFPPTPDIAPDVMGRIDYMRLSCDTAIRALHGIINELNYTNETNVPFLGILAIR